MKKTDIKVLDPVGGGPNFAFTGRTVSAVRLSTGVAMRYVEQLQLMVTPVLGGVRGLPKVEFWVAALRALSEPDCWTNSSRVEVRAFSPVDAISVLVAQLKDEDLNYALSVRKARPPKEKHT